MSDPKRWLVTGGAGFIGSALVHRLAGGGDRVRVFDNLSRGRAGRLADLGDRVEMVTGDLRDPAAVAAAVRGVDAVCHLGAVNGTEFFYTRPDLVLEVAVKGIVNVLDACRAAGVGELAIASSSEVYQTPPVVPTPETVPLVVPDPWNPRYSYGAGKIISEMLGIHVGAKHLKRVVLFRPHNVYGPDMGWEHVIPQFAVRLGRLAAAAPGGRLRFPIQGSGAETRAFTFIDDFVDGLLLVLARGESRGLYHIGTGEEVTIARLAELVAARCGRAIDLVPGPPAEGGTPRRCPDVAKLAALGYRPSRPLEIGLAATVPWYLARLADAPPERRG